MTKAELLKLLEPFADDVDVIKIHHDRIRRLAGSPAMWISNLIGVREIQGQEPGVILIFDDEAEVI